VSTRVTLKCVGGARGDAALDGWALNVSRGGIRVILEDKVEPGEEFEITLADGALAATAAGDSPVSTRAQRGCVVWVQEEHDGVVAGIAFKNAFVSGDQAAPKPTGG
jgi:hypothetical protein